MKTLLIDNYDSFSYNLSYLLKGLNQEVQVTRPDQVLDKELEEADLIVLSPGPGLPKEMPGLMSIIQHYSATKPMLGVCLGHQAIAEHFGAELFNLPEVYHGVQDQVFRTQGRFYNPALERMDVGRYHSWACKNLPSSLCLTAEDAAGMVMAMEHKSLPIFGLQFHPESVMCPQGKELVEYFLKEIQS